MPVIVQARRGERPAEGERLYVPAGGIREAWSARDPELVLDGPAGSGKSIGALNRLHILATRYPNSRHVIVRKTRESMTQSTIVSWEKLVLPEGWESSINFSHERQQYEYPNGAIVAVGGLNKDSRVMSTEWDTIFVDECTELEESEWEALSTRCRYGILPWQQLLGGCNPDRPTHWVRQRASAGRLRLIETRHEDNPRLWNAKDSTWTAYGAAYIARLDQLTGVRHKRLRLGLWVAAEGIIYEEYDASIHLVDRFDVPKEWPRYLAVDFGYTNPFVAQWWTTDPDGRLILYREIYRTQTLVEDHAKQIIALCQKEGIRPRAVVCDHDAEGRATLSRYFAQAWGPRFGTLAAIKDVSEGIQAVQARLRKAGDGKPRLMFMRDSLVERDPDLAERKLPLCTTDEIEGYVWDTGNGKKIKEDPLKLNDHGCLIAGTLVTTASGDVPIERIQPGDLVLTSDGYRPVLVAACTSPNTNVMTLTCSDGHTLTGTPNHPVNVGGAWVPMDRLRYGDILQAVEDYLEVGECREQLPTELNPSSIGGLSSDAIQTQITGRLRGTTHPTVTIERRASADYIRRFGVMLTGRFLKAATSTISTVTRLTMPLATLLVLVPRNINSYTTSCIDRFLFLQQDLSILRESVRSRWSGTVRKLDVLGIASTGGKFGLLGFPLRESATSVALGSHPSLIASQTASAQTTANRPGGARLDSTTLTAPARSAEKHADSTSTHTVSSVPVSVLSVVERQQPEPVYNLSVDATVGEYFANGILVHNCDCTRYICAAADLAGDGRPMSVKFGG